MRGASPYLAAVISAVLVDLANDDRSSEALPDLNINPLLVAAAQAKADDMAAKSYFAHKSPDGKDSWHWFKQVGYDYAYAGENLAVNFADSVDVEKAWMQSPTHRANIMNGRYTEIGIATAVGMYQGRQTVFAVQMFGRPAAAAVSTAPAPIADIAVGSNVLGESDEEDLEPVGALAEQDGDASVILAPEQVPWWGRILAMPLSTLRTIYLVIGFLVLTALFFDMELEWRWHHFKHAMRAGSVLAIMSMLFIAADWFFFAEPILAIAGALL